MVASFFQATLPRLAAPPAKQALADLADRDLTVGRALGAALNDMIDAAADVERELGSVAELVGAGLPFDPRPLKAARERLRRALKMPPAEVTEAVRIVPRDRLLPQGVARDAL